MIGQSCVFNFGIDWMNTPDRGRFAIDVGRRLFHPGIFSSRRSYL